MESTTRRLVDSEASARVFHTGNEKSFYLVDADDVSDVHIDPSFSSFCITSESSLTDEQTNYIVDIINYFWLSYVHCHNPLSYTMNSSREIVFSSKDNASEPLFSEESSAEYLLSKLEHFATVVGIFLEEGSTPRVDGTQKHSPIPVPWVNFWVDHVYEDIEVLIDDRKMGNVEVTITATSSDELERALDSAEISNLIQKDTCELTMGEIARIHEYAVMLTNVSKNLISEKRELEEKLKSVKTALAG